MAIDRIARSLALSSSVGTDSGKSVDEVLIFQSKKTEFPSIGVDNALYIDKESMAIYMWNSEKLQYEQIKNGITKEEIENIVKETQDAEVRQIVHEEIEYHVLYCGSSEEVL